MIKKIVQKIFGREDNEPKAVQCLWNSDWEYIGLLIELVFKDYTGYRTQKIIELEYKNFKTQKELVQEAEKIAKEYADKYNIVLYFPSPDEWSRNCPNWWESHSAPKCEDCKIPIIPTESKHLPKEVCYPCHLERERKERIKNAEPYDDGVTMYLYKDGKHENIGYCTHFQSFTIAPFITDIVQQSEFTYYINLITLESPMILDLINKLENAIEKALENYEEPLMEPGIEQFVIKKKVVFKNREIELMDRFNKSHENISRLISSYNTAQKAMDENYIYQIYFKKGITYRDDSILRFVHYVNKNKADKSSILEHYKNILTERELMESISKLEENGCLKIVNSKYIVTDLGMKVL